MRVVENLRTGPHYNLALEEHLCSLAGEGREFFMLWRNEPSVIIGRFQDALAEVDAEFLRQHRIPVLRRNSGGGAVYHDLGNVNYSFIMRDRRELDFPFFAGRVVAALASLGVEAEFEGRNDIAVGGRKVSGMAQWRHDGAILCHGTLLFDCDLGMMSSALRPPGEKLARHGVRSAQSRVENLKPFLMGIADGLDFMSRLGTAFQEGGAAPVVLSEWDEAEVQRLMRGKYRSQKWNYGGELDEVL